MIPIPNKKRWNIQTPLTLPSPLVGERVAESRVIDQSTSCH